MATGRAFPSKSGVGISDDRHEGSSGIVLRVILAVFLPCTPAGSMQWAIQGTVVTPNEVIEDGVNVTDEKIADVGQDPQADVAAGSLLVEEAGGRVTNMDGSALDLEGARIVASNRRLHRQMLSTLA